MKINEFREMSSDELLVRRNELKEEAFNLQVQKESGQLDNPARIRIVRRAVARIETTLSDRSNNPAVSA
ncbi:MAG: large subunit ribosomal protein L29 [Verrucomicrobiales bacterium]|jgi:large subunit ribosomal protein L29